MAEAASNAAVAKAGSKKKDASKKPNLWKRTVRYWSEVISELKKVVTPTKKEWAKYSLTVVVFVSIVMAIILTLDFFLGKLAFWVFG